MFLTKFIPRFFSCLVVMMALFGSTSPSFAKPHINKPHVGNPVKAAKKAEHSAAKNTSHAAKSTTKNVKKAGKTAVTGAKKAGKTAVTSAKKAGTATVKAAKKAGKSVEKGAEALTKGLEKKIMAVVKKLMSDTKFLTSLLNPALKAAKLPNFEDMKNTAKCVAPTLKDLKALIQKSKNPLDPGVSAILKKLKNGKCKKELETLADDCKGPGVLAATMTPAGGAIAGICGKVSSTNSRINTTVSAVELAQKDATAAKETLKGEESSDDEEDSGDDDES